MGVFVEMAELAEWDVDGHVLNNLMGVALGLYKGKWKATRAIVLQATCRD